MAGSKHISDSTCFILRIIKTPLTFRKLVPWIFCSDESIPQSHSMRNNNFFFWQFLCSSDVLQLQVKGSSRNLGQFQASVIRCDYPQNADLPRHYSKKEKKPFPVPIVELRRAARERFKKCKGQPKKPIPPPKNGLVVKSLIPLAYSVLNARITLINNLKRLLKVVPVLGCK